MPTVIDSLVLELGLDPKKFIGGQKEISASLRRMIEDARRGGNETEKRSREIGESISSLKREALGLAAFFMGGMGAKSFLQHITSMDAATGRFASRLGLANQELSAWEGAVQTVGGAAGEATSALVGMESELQRFLLTGQGAYLPLLNELNVSQFKHNGMLKTAAELYLDISDAIKKGTGDPRRIAALLGMVPGMNQGTMNLLMLGRPEIQKRLDQARASAPTDADIEAAKQYQKAASELDRAATNFGRIATVLASPAILGMLEAATRLFTSMNTGKLGGPAAERKTGTFWDSVYEWTDKKLFGPKTPMAPMTPLPEMPKLAPLPSGQEPAKASAFRPSVQEQIAYIRAAATRRGIDPDVAVEVAKREGLYNWKSSIPGEESYGPFQLHYGGRGQKGALAAKGLGDDFTKQTGLDAADPANWKQGVDFALDAARSRGWGAWYGWKGAKWEGIPRPGTFGAPAAAVMGPGRGPGTGAAGDSTTTTTVSIGQITVTSQATDAEGIARDIGPAIRRQTLVAPADHGQE